MAFERLINSLNPDNLLVNMRKSIEIVQKEARVRCPVDKGLLIDSSEINQISKTEWELVFVNDYGIYVHEILHNNHPLGEAKFLENAWGAKKGEFLKELTSGMF